jgi:uncharacterized membrane protein
MRRLPFPFVLSTVVSTIILIGVLVTGTNHRLWMGWNLFLAWVPVPLVAYALFCEERKKPLPCAISGLLAWLFFPNTIYLITDLQHIHGEGTSVFHWLRTTMIGALAIAGASLAVVLSEAFRERVALRRGELFSWCAAALLWFTTGIGVWLGRVQRWNSWDALMAPHHVVRDVLGLFLSPMDHLNAWFITLLFASLVAVLQVGTRLTDLLHTNARSLR